MHSLTSQERFFLSCLRGSEHDAEAMGFTVVLSKLPTWQ